ncbi:hypothetical protein I6B53_05310 [Schaalia sp. 19OD2882]|uniref:hypothetical protein n=1 Tax=Schaalia sp. 19OD2882 TaxID=2794089 RepID=UPI001C1EE71F|nr:hypothetical protein [Schaalia sp. 19OD2882]QWW20483.1 hypothetical protein I6B53_05310 [Schaalia sp. 19OD2882]
MAVDDKAFERLLTFYPKRWRETNGEVFLATAIEEARVRGRERPDAALRLSALTHGWGTRLGLRSALVAAPAGALLALAHQWIFMTVWIDVAQVHSLDADHPLRIALSIGESTIALILIPLLSLIAIASLVRVGGRLLPPRASSSWPAGQPPSVPHGSHRWHGSSSGQETHKESAPGRAWSTPCNGGRPSWSSRAWPLTCPRRSCEPPWPTGS